MLVYTEGYRQYERFSVGKNSEYSVRMSGKELETATTPAEEGHHVIKFYRDVGDEVDSHFARALQPSKHANFFDKSEGDLHILFFADKKKLMYYNIR